MKNVLCLIYLQTIEAKLQSTVEKITRQANNIYISAITIFIYQLYQNQLGWGGGFYALPLKFSCKRKTFELGDYFR